MPVSEKLPPTSPRQHSLYLESQGSPRPGALQLLPDMRETRPSWQQWQHSWKLNKNTSYLFKLLIKMLNVFPIPYILVSNSLDVILAHPVVIIIINIIKCPANLLWRLSSATTRHRQQHVATSLHVIKKKLSRNFSR